MSAGQLVQVIHELMQKVGTNTKRCVVHKILIGGSKVNTIQTKVHAERTGPIC